MQKKKCLIILKHFFFDFKIIIMSKNNTSTSMRIFNSIKYYGLDITRAALVSGMSIAPYLNAFKTDLFLSASEEDVQEAINANIAAGIICTGNGLPIDANEEITQIKIAFDGDAVIFSDEAEKVFKEKGLLAFEEHEEESLAFEHEFERDGKSFKYEFMGWFSNADTYSIHVSKTTAFFYMPDEDVEITPIFRIVDTTEYFDWASVVKDVDKLRRNQSLEVDMEDETVQRFIKKCGWLDREVVFVSAVTGENLDLLVEKTVKDQENASFEEESTDSAYYEDHSIKEDTFASEGEKNEDRKED